MTSAIETAAKQHHLRGAALWGQGLLTEALACFDEALRLSPDLPEALADRGSILMHLGRPADAEESYRAALRVWPRHPEIHNLLGAALLGQGRYDDAEGFCLEALRLEPHFAQPYYSLALIRTAQGKPDEALACYEQAVRIKPDYGEALTNLGNAYREQRRIDEAIACYRQASVVRADPLPSQNNVLLALHCRAQYDPHQVFAEHVHWGAQFEPAPRPAPADRNPTRRLRIGYVSGDFRQHVMGVYAQAIITAHDRTEVEVFGYANVSEPDVLTNRLIAAADHWRSVVRLSDAQAAEVIRQDQVDVLIDLSGHTAGNRLGIFARRSAPVQVTHCGYAGTTGLSAVDYRLMDAHCDPPGQTERFHTEKLVRLPEVHWCYVPPSGPEPGPLPALETGSVTFGSLNGLYKVTNEMIGIWSQILQRVPGSRILILAGVGSAADEALWVAFQKHGIDRSRVTLVSRQGQEAYLRLYHGVDICLDTHPYAGCNTTADALWMGVPVVVLAGPTCISRLGVSALVHAGLEGLVTQSPAAYVETAVSLAQDLPHLKTLRAQLRDRMRRSPLTDVQRFTRNLEAAYRAMWRQFCGS